MKQIFQKIIPGGLATIAILSVPILASSYTYADDVVDEINITVPVSCTLSGIGMDSHNAEIINGTFDSAIGETTIKAYCNDSDGFAIYAIGYTDNEDGNNVLTNSSLSSTYDIATGTATGPVNNVDASAWAMKLSTITSPVPTYPIIIAGSTADTDREQGDPDYSTFQEVPDDYTIVAKRTSGTDIGTSAEGSTLKSTYQVYVSKTQPAGTYTGQVKYTLVHPNDAAKPEIPVTIATAEYFQEVNTCPADLIEEQVYTLKDSRDEQEYKVAKLKDGKCWMVENLNIAGGAALSSIDTDFDSNYTLPTTDGWTVTDNKLVLPASSTSGFSIDNYAYLYNSNNKENCGSSGQNSPCYSYYSWDTATLGSGRSLATVDADAPYSVCPKGWRLPTSGTETTWKRGDFYVLATSYGANLESLYLDGSATFYNNAGPSTVPNFILSGYNGTSSIGENGYYWSSTMTSGTLVNQFLFSPNIIFSSGSNSNKMGYPVRCLLKTN